DGQATFVIHQGQVTGTIMRGEATFRIEPAQGMHALVKIGPTLFPKEDAEPRLKEGYEERRNAAPPPMVGGAPAPATTDIAVLVAYTPSAASATKSMAGLIHQAIQEANDSYVNSDIKIHLNLIDSFQFRYSEGSKTFDRIVQDFATNVAVNARRDQSGADVSV